MWPYFHQEELITPLDIHLFILVILENNFTGQLILQLVQLTWLKQKTVNTYTISFLHSLEMIVPLISLLF